MHILSAEEETRQMDGQTDNKAGSENKSIYRKQTDRSIDVDTTKSLNWKFEAFEAKPNEHTHTYIHTQYFFISTRIHAQSRRSCMQDACLAPIHPCLHSPTRQPTYPPTHACTLACIFMWLHVLQLVSNRPCDKCLHRCLAR